MSTYRVRRARAVRSTRSWAEERGLGYGSPEHIEALREHYGQITARAIRAGRDRREDATYEGSRA